MRSIEKSNSWRQKVGCWGQGLEGERGSEYLMGTEFLFREMTQFCRQMVVKAAQQRECT